MVSKVQNRSLAEASLPDALSAAGRRLAGNLNRLKFSPPVVYVYNPLDYAWAPYELYLRKYAVHPKRVLFLGMNPGPFGMVQTGIPFGEVAAVKRWLRLETRVDKPAQEHPRRPVEGFNCRRSEVSGRRLWQLFEDRFKTAEAFFQEHFVLNYCPLAFMEASGRNLTPDKLPAAERAEVLRLCDEHLREAIRLLRPEYAVGVGGFAAERLKESCGAEVRCAQILHPSPANPAANRGWAAAAAGQLRELRIWPEP